MQVRKENVITLLLGKHAKMFFMFKLEEKKMNDFFTQSSYYCLVGKYCSKIVVFNLSEWYTIRLELLPLPSLLLSLPPTTASTYTTAFLPLLLTEKPDHYTHIWRCAHTHIIMQTRISRFTHTCKVSRPDRYTMPWGTEKGMNRK